MPGVLCMSSHLPVIQICPGVDSQRRIKRGTSSGKESFAENRLEDMYRHLGSCRTKTNPIRSIQSKSPDWKMDKISQVELPSHVNYISSVANPYVKHLVKLRQSTSYRHSVGSVVVVGSTPLREVSEYLQQNSVEQVVDCLFVQDVTGVPVGLLETSRRIVHVNHLVMQKLAGVESIESTEAIGVIKLPSSFCNLESLEIHSSSQIWSLLPHRLLVLDGIQDPGNLGTLVRTAVAFQWDGVFLLPGCCDPFNEKALRASQGACFQLPIGTGLWSNLEIIRDRYQMNMYAAQQASSKINEETMTRKYATFGKDKNSNIPELSQRDSIIKGSTVCNGHNPILLSHEFAYAVTDTPLCLVLGSEGKGLSEQSRKSCNLVAIPMPGGFESLNVSVAGGIFLFLLRRQQ